LCICVCCVEYGFQTATANTAMQSLSLQCILAAATPVQTFDTTLLCVTATPVTATPVTAATVSAATITTLIVTVTVTAVTVGGAVHCLLGNHEIFNAKGDHSMAKRQAFVPFNDLKPEVSVAVYEFE
jgi:hypothetical protein